MLVLASANKLGESTMQPSVAASLLRIDDERAEVAFNVLRAPDPKSRNKECEGRRIVPKDDGGWFIVSHQRYQYLASRAAATQRQKRYEERKSEREQDARIQESTCEQEGCSMPVELAVAGRKVCNAHGFEPPSREPGEEG